MKALYSLSILFAATALFALSMPVTAFSQMKNMPAEGRGQMMQMDNMDKMGDMMGMCIQNADRMGLTDDQVMKMKPLHREMQKKQAQFKADLKIAEIELMEIMDVKNFDMEKAATAVKKIEGIKTAHHLEMLRAMKEMRSDLTDEQFKKMQKMMPMKTGMKKPAKRMMKK
ncbi:MAG: hypothetical protein PHR66_10135 [Desulfuromonadaceae bacterium]|nr:hypothetical protein [Desulfuromonadaceae bacterium]